MRSTSSKLFLVLWLVAGLAHSFNCKLHLAPNFKIENIEDVKNLLTQIESLDFLQEKRELNQILAQVREAPDKVKSEMIPIIIERLKESKSKDTTFGYGEKGILQRMLSAAHNADEHYQKGTSGKAFLDSFLKTRLSSYNGSDLIALAEGFQEKIRAAKKVGVQVDRIVLSGSVVSGVAKTPGSDVDFLVFPISAAKNVFDTKDWYLPIYNHLNNLGSPLRNLDFQRGEALHPSLMSYMAETNKLMIEVSENEINLILIPEEMNVADMRQLEHRVPLQR